MNSAARFLAEGNREVVLRYLPAAGSLYREHFSDKEPSCISGWTRAVVILRPHEQLWRVSTCERRADMGDPAETFVRFLTAWQVAYSEHRPVAGTQINNTPGSCPDDAFEREGGLDHGTQAR